MKTESFIMHMGLLLLFYFLGITIMVALLNFFNVTFYQVSYLFITMSVVSIFLIGVYSKKMLGETNKLLNRVIIAFLLLMTFMLLFCAFDLMEPWEMSIF